MSKAKNVDYNQVKKAISLSEDWFALSGSLFAAKVDPAITKCFFKSNKAAGRAYIVIDTTNKTITLTDYMKGAESFEAVAAAEVLKAAGLVTEEKPAAKQTKPAAKKTAATTKPAASQQPAAIQFSRALVEDANGKTTIASLLHAGKAYAGRTVPAGFAARFAKYSYDNQLLLYLQGGENLGPVATYKGWLKKGRHVSKGQHGLKILAPRMVVKDGQKVIDGLRLVTLFSVEQTEELEMKEA